MPMVNASSSIFENLFLVKRSKAIKTTFIQFDPDAKMMEVSVGEEMAGFSMKISFDPNNIYAAGRQVFSKEEFNALPQEMFDAINGLRESYALSPVER